MLTMSSPDTTNQAQKPDSLQVPGIIVPYKQNASEELRYTLQGLKNLPHGKVVVVGDPYTHPVNLPYLSRQPLHDVEQKIMTGLDLMVSPDFYLFNDDFFILAAMETVPYYHRGTLQDHMDARPRHDSYWQTLKDTLTYLRNQGIDEPLSYELHVPMLMNVERRRELHNRVRPELERGKQLLMRSVYGNLYNVGGGYMQDPKISDLTSIPSGDIASTTEQSFNGGEAGKYIRNVIK